TSCTPVTSSVTAYDPATNTWEELADYPVAVAHLSCGGLDGQVFCTGGTTGGTDDGIADTYAYDPATDTWSEAEEAPVRSWGAQYATANGLLVLNGGIQDDLLSNATYAYDPDQAEWTQLPNADTVV